MAIHLQLGFTDYEQAYAKKKTRRQIFLEEMEATVPWDSFLSLIQPLYYRPTAKGGRPPFPLEVMLRIHLLQQWFTLSESIDGGDADRHPCFRRFAGIDMIEGRIPDETTILNFRHLLEEHQIAEQILECEPESEREWCDAQGGDDPGCDDHQCAQFNQEQEYPFRGRDTPPFQSITDDYQRDPRSNSLY